MHALRLLIIVIGIFQSALSLAEMVEVEPTYIVTSETTGEYKLLPYRERRPKWGVTTALGYSSYEPVNYEPNFLAAEFADIYETPELPMIEFQLVVKRNFPIGSAGVELAVGYYMNESDRPDLIDSKLTLMPVRLGVHVSLDTLMPEPFIMPYFSGGLYTMIFKEEMGGNSYKGNTRAAPYLMGGVSFMLDWIDRKAARLSFQEANIQSTSAYVQAYKYFLSDAAADDNFENDVSWGAGVRVEF